MSAEAWDHQLAQIENRGADVEDIFGANGIDMIGSDGAYLSCDEIFEVMFGSE